MVSSTRVQIFGTEPASSRIEWCHSHCTFNYVWKLKTYIITFQTWRTYLNKGTTKASAEKLPHTLKPTHDYSTSMPLIIRTYVQRTASIISFSNITDLISPTNYRTRCKFILLKKRNTRAKWKNMPLYLRFPYPPFKNGTLSSLAVLVWLIQLHFSELPSKSSYCFPNWVFIHMQVSSIFKQLKHYMQ